MFDATPDRINWLENIRPLPPSCPELAARARQEVEDSEAELKEQEEQDAYEEARKTPRRQTLTPTAGRPRTEGSIRTQFPSNIVSLYYQYRINDFLMYSFQCKICGKKVQPATTHQFKKHLAQHKKEEDTFKCNVKDCIYVSYIPVLT